MKYPRTPHLPYSPGLASDDILLASDSHFHGMTVRVSEKLDGENTSLHSDRVHARSQESRHHESRSWIKKFHATVKHLIPEIITVSYHFGERYTVQRLI